MQTYFTIRWDDGRVVLLDQRALPARENYLVLTDYREVGEAIRTLAVRGAPAIGVAGAMAAALGALELKTTDQQEFKARFVSICRELAQVRPTAVNLSWALKIMEQVVQDHPAEPVAALKERLVAAAQRLLEEDRAANRRLGEIGREVIRDGDQVLTHCNTGPLATAGFGTALGVMAAAWDAGKRFSVWVDETRPLLQGARLTTWELKKLGIPFTLIPDSAAATLMRQGRVSLAIVGADRIAANGDTANKIGTYGVAVLAHYHSIPFYVAAPLSTCDFSLPDGSHIPVEERDPEEVTHLLTIQVAPEGAPALNLAFDVTPNELISGIITEKGLARPPFLDSLNALRET